jgi:uncharacterized protein (DUF1330 family)
MPKGYVIFTESIRDPEAMAAYGQASFPTMMQAGAKVLVGDDRPDVREGEWPGSRTVIVEFDSVASARDWYLSPEYQAAIPLRQAGADANVVILAGFEMPGGAADHS